MAYNKRTAKQKRINKAQERLDRDNARSARDIKRNKWNIIKTNIMLFAIGSLVLAVFVLYLMQ